MLEKMLLARKGLGGHHGYGHSRNALEMLERLEVEVSSCSEVYSRLINDSQSLQ